MPVLVVGAPLVHGNRVFNCAVVDPPRRDPRRRPEVLPARPTASSTSAAGSRRATTARWSTITVAGQEVPFGPDLIFRAIDVPGLDLHVEICEDMWVPVPPSAEAALAGATVLANLSGSPITVARAEDRRLLVRSASARCSAAYVYAAAGQGESTTDLSGTARRWSTSAATCSPRASGSPTVRGARSSTSTSTGSARSGCGRAPSTTTGAPTTSGSHRVPHRRVRARAARPATSACAARSTASRSCPTTPSGSPSTATRPTTSRSPGSSSGSTPIGQPKVVIGVSGGLDSTHALIVAAKAMDRLGRPRSDILAFTMPGFATGETTKSYATRLSQVARRDLRGARHPAAAEQMLDGPRTTPSPTARRSTTSPSRTSRPGCAPTTCSGSPTSAAASCSAPATSPSSRWAGAPTASATRCRTTTSTPASRRR